MPGYGLWLYYIVTLFAFVIQPFLSLRSFFSLGLFAVVCWFVSVILHGAMAARHTAPASVGGRESNGDVPATKRDALRIYEFFSVTGMDVVAGLTCPSLTGVCNVDVVEIR